MLKQKYTDWIKDHLEEMFTAALTAFFTALMFRLGMTMMVSIVTGLVLAYAVRLILVKMLVDALRRKLDRNRSEDL